MTRKEYMSNPVWETHCAYYSQYVTDGLRRVVGETFGEEILTSSDRNYFNDIKLNRWDALAASLQSSWLSIAKQLTENGDSLTQSSKVCILKESARQWLEDARERTQPKMREAV